MQNLILNSEEAKKMTDAIAIESKCNDIVHQLMTLIFGEIFTEVYRNGVFCYTRHFHKRYVVPFWKETDFIFINEENYVFEIRKCLNNLGYSTVYTPKSIFHGGKLVISWENAELSPEEIFNEDLGGISVLLKSGKIINYLPMNATAKKTKKFTNFLKKDKKMVDDRNLAVIVRLIHAQIYCVIPSKSYSLTKILEYNSLYRVPAPNDPAKNISVHVNEQQYASEICKYFNELGYKIRYLPKKFFQSDSRLVITWD